RGRPVWVARSRTPHSSWTPNASSTTNQRAMGLVGVRSGRVASLAISGLRYRSSGRLSRNTGHRAATGSPPTEAPDVMAIAQRPRSRERSVERRGALAPVGPGDTDLRTIERIEQRVLWLAV